MDCQRTATSVTNIGRKTELFSIEQTALNRTVAADDHLIIGFPVYGSTAPSPMLDFIAALSPGTGQPVSVFACQATASGDASYFIARRLKQKGYSPRSLIHFNTPNSFCTPRFKYKKPITDKKRADALLCQKLLRVNQFAQEIISPQQHLRGHHPLWHLLGSLQRMHVDSVIRRIGKDLLVMTKRCVHCGSCITNCPTKNISVKDGHYLFANRCAGCLRCYTYCPKHAICIGEKSANTIKYPRYCGPSQLTLTDLR